MNRDASMTDCQACPNRVGADLCDLDGQAGADFQAITQTVLYQPGQFVFYEGHAALGLYILCSGRLKLTRSTARGQCRMVGIIDPGQLVERHVFQDAAVHEATCEALERSQVCVIDRVRFLALVEREGALGVKIIQLLSRAMGQSLDETDQLAFGTARERVAALLVDLAARYGEETKEGTQISLQLKREELAQMAAISLETAVRLLQSLHADRIISLQGRDITILQADRLACVAKQAGPSQYLP